MQFFKSGLICLLFFSFIRCSSDSDHAVKSHDKNNFQTADAFEQTERLAPGVNFGNALEAPNEGDWGMTIEWNYFYLLSGAGFRSIRIPIRWSSHALESAPYNISESFFDRIDGIVLKTLELGMIAVINVHHYEELFEDPQTQKTRFKHIWAQIAGHYQGYHEDLIFEILNEPHDKINATGVWNDYFPEILDTIRVSNPTRNIIIGPGGWNSINEIPNLVFPEDDHHLIATFHYYEPFTFTHQGADWVDGSEAWLGTTWTATASQRSRVAADFNKARTWSEQNYRPVYMGEFGAYSAADMTSRVAWTDYVARQAEAFGFGWAYWEFGAGFGVYDRDKKIWRADLLEALIPKE
ncbi:glycoside hydrolase family 5 protein [bacterium]|nr:glycoside hydrolase family 5 protein [bacterium]